MRLIVQASTAAELSTGRGASMIFFFHTLRFFGDSSFPSIYVHLHHLSRRSIDLPGALLPCVNLGGACIFGSCLL